MKLHGSVGMWVADFPGDPMYLQEEPKDRHAATIGDDLFFSDPPSTPGIVYAEREPLLFFPSERQFVASNDSGFLFHRYARAILDRAKELISNATEIHVIGYSFAGIDRGPVLDMLETASKCRHLIIQGPDANQICERLRFERPRLRDLIEPAPFAF